MSAVLLQPVLIEEVIAMTRSKADFKRISKFHEQFFNSDLIH